MTSRLLLAATALLATAGIASASTYEDNETHETVYIFDEEIDGICYNIIDDQYLTVAAKDTIKTMSVLTDCPPEAYVIFVREPQEFYTRTVNVPAEAYVKRLGKTLPVKGIDIAAFAFCPKLEQVLLPSSIERISMYAFAYSTQLRYVNLDDLTISEIPAAAFQSCESISLPLGLPGTITTIGNGAFYDSGLSSITIPPSVETIGFSAFKCPYLHHVTCLVKDPSKISLWHQQDSNNASFQLPDDATLYLPEQILETYRTDPTWSAIFPTIKAANNIDYYSAPDVEIDGIAYSITPDRTLTVAPLSPLYTTSVQGDSDELPIYNASTPARTYTGAVTVPATVTVPELGATLPVTGIEPGAFAHSTALTSVTLPASVQTVGIAAFHGCTALTALDLSATALTTLPNGTCEDCTALTTLSLPATLATIDANAFSRTALTAMQLPDAVTTCSEGSYSGSALTSFTAGKSLTEIGHYALARTPLTTIDWGQSQITVIKPRAFSETQLTTLTIPATVTTFGANALTGCTELTSVTSLATDPTAIAVPTYVWHMADTRRNTIEVPQGCTLHVPAQSIEAYRADPAWSAFSQILPIGQTEITELTTDTPTDAPAYDLLGRRVTTPRPGTPIIRAGRLQFR